MSGIDAEQRARLDQQDLNGMIAFHANVNGLCDWCHYCYPCPTVRLVEEVRLLQRERDALERRLAAMERVALDGKPTTPEQLRECVDAELAKEAGE